MPRFITRIELKAASQKDYQKLEEEMKKASFKDANKNTARRQALGTSAEFNRIGNYTLLEVTDAAVKAARKTGRNYSFTVMKEKKLSIH
ncbi:MAG: hypothetical protein ABIU63_07870 [Chitinophagaceae bacterium]